MRKASIRGMSLTLAAALVLGTSGSHAGTSVSCSSDPETLSGLARSILTAIRAIPDQTNSPVPAEYLVTGCNRFLDALVDGPEIFKRIKQEIGKAKFEVDIGMFGWEEGSDAARLIGDGLRDASKNRKSGDRLHVRLLINKTFPRAINHLYNSEKAWALDDNKVLIQKATYPGGAIGAFHDKLVVVDGRVLIVTGANPEKHHDNKPNRWHDSGYVLRGPVAYAGLKNFDQVWNESDHWSCWPQNFAFDCQTGSGFPAPSRGWLKLDPTPGDTTFVIAAGRKARNSINNDVDNPQDQAWLAALESARRWVNIETPNINDNAFQDAVIKAAGRGVVIRLITSNRFNEYRENLGQGGDNREIVGKLRGRMRSEYPNGTQNLKLCWYSRDGIYPVVGKDDGPSHLKYMSIDGEVAIVGSGNMDTASWNQSHEFNVVIDGRSEVARMDEVVFDKDWRRAVCSLLEFYEGNNGTQDLVYSASAIGNRSYNFTTLEHFINDEAKSVVLYDVPAGRVIRIFDSPEGHTDDDWLEIIVKRHIGEKVISTLEQNLDNDDVRAIYHRNNGLDGKVSRVHVTSSPVGARADLYEGKNATQNLVCSVNVTKDKSINFNSSGSYRCNNDEAKSLVLYDMPVGRILRLYDSPSGDREDDWIEIEPLTHLAKEIVPSLEETYNNGRVRVTYYRNNGLNGKVSRLEVKPRSSITGVVSFYEGKHGSQNKLCDRNVYSRTITFGGECDNDEAKSLVLTNAKAGTTIWVYDDPGCGTGDDWTRIDVKRNVDRTEVGTFEDDFENADVKVNFHRHNGLNGKVSCAKIRVP